MKTILSCSNFKIIVVECLFVRSCNVITSFYVLNIKIVNFLAFPFYSQDFHR